MNHQGGQMGQFSRIANRQNDVDHRETNRTLRLFSSSLTGNGSGPRFLDRFSSPIVGPDRDGPNMLPTNDHHSAAAGTFHNEPVGSLGINISSFGSLPGGNDQRLPGRLFGSNLLTYQRNNSNGFTPIVSIPPPHGIASAAGNSGNNNNNNNSNANVSLDLSLQPYGSQTQQGAGSSSSVVPSAITSPGGAPEQGGDDGGALRRMPFKRSTPDYAFREYAVGESSSAGAAPAAAGVPKRRAANENVHSSATCTCTTCPLHSNNYSLSGDQHETGMNNAGRGSGSWSITEVQQALQAESFQSNIDLQAGNAQGFVQPNNMLSSMGYMRSDSHVPFSGGQQAPLSFYQQSFFSHAETSPVAAFGGSVHPFENFSHFRDSQYGPSWTNITRPRTAPPVSFPLRSVMARSEATAPFQSTRNNVSGNYLNGSPRIGRGSWAQIPANSSLSSGHNTNLLGSIIPQAAASSSSTQNGSVVQHGTGGAVPAFQQLSNIARAWIQRLNVHEEYLRISSGPAGPSDPPQVPQVDVSTGLANPRHETERRPVAGVENQAVGSNLPPYIADSSRLRDEIRNAIEHLRNGGSIRLEELLILDYSIVLNLLESVTELDEPNVEEMPYEALLNMEEQIGNADVGLTENEILIYIGREIFRSIAEQAQQNDACSICQEDYVHGEELGRLDCGHRYHLGCIKQWLILKNTCPVCKQMALTIIDEDEDDDE